MKTVILAGGGGSRLFPLSRSCYPKQFLHIAGEKSLLVQTIERFLGLAAPEDIIIVTNKRLHLPCAGGAERSRCGGSAHDYRICRA